MKARLLRAAALDQLRTSIATNLKGYRSQGFDHLDADSSLHFDIDVEVDIGRLSELKAPSSGKLFEAENCTTTYGALQNLSPYSARDERFWVYLSHTALLEYARQRWPIPTEDLKAVDHIAKHWFARDKRQVERDQVGSRLWWMGHLCGRVAEVSPDVALRALLFRSDVRANLVERPTVAQSVDLFTAILKRLAQSLESQQKLFERNTFRKLMIEINSVGGYRVLDCLGASEIDRVVDSVIADQLSLKDF